MASNSAENFLIVQSGFLGDVVLSTPVFVELRQRFPEARLTLLTTPGAAPLLQEHEALDDVIVFDKRGKDRGLRGFLRMRAELRRRQFSKVFCLHKSYRSSLLCFLSGISERYGFEESSLSFLHTHRSSRSHLPHEVQRNAAVLSPLGLDAASFAEPMSLGLSDESRVRAAELLRPLAACETLIAVAPGSVWATKRWTEEGFTEVIRQLHAQGHGIVLIGGPDDRDRTDRIHAALGSVERVCDLVAACSLAVSAAVVRRVDVLVSNDSAPLHLASAVQTPCVALFCATVPEFGFGPWQNQAEVLGVSGLACRPCGRHGGNHCPTGTHACQRELSSSVVLAAVERLLRQQKVKRHEGCES